MWWNIFNDCRYVASFLGTLEEVKAYVAALNEMSDAAELYDTYNFVEVKDNRKQEFNYLYEILQLKNCPTSKVTECLKKYKAESEV